jgi:hypothetical protein
MGIHMAMAMTMFRFATAGLDRLARWKNNNETISQWEQPILRAVVPNIRHRGMYCSEIRTQAQEEAFRY